MRCRHCRWRKRNKPRGLCWTCSQSPEIRAMYPLVPNKFNRRGTGNHCGGRVLPDAPTRARQGTPEKVAVLAARAEAGTALWHPNDGDRGDLR